MNISSVAGRRADAGAAVYNMTKFGVHALLGGAPPGGAPRGHQGHDRGAGLRGDGAPGPQRQPARAQDDGALTREQIGEVLRAEDIAEQIVHAVSLPAHVCVNEVVVRPTGQAR